MIMGLKEIAGNFALNETVKEITPLGEGFINDTFVIQTENPAVSYILQRKNSNIFRDVPGMMSNIEKVTAHIRRKVEQRGGDIRREVMTVIPAKDGKLFFRDENGGYWTVCLFISDTAAYNEADSPETARKGGKGIGRFQSLLSDFDGSLAETIPGFHNMKVRFEQWDKAISDDAAHRVKDLAEEIGWIEARREEMLAYRELVDKGMIPERVTHNDTKINNILFDRNGDVLCVIDLDTVMKAPVHNDFGDAIRTYTNTGAEDDTDPDNVSMSIEFFEAYSDGYLSEQARNLTRAELDYLAFSALYITFEQVLRFLMDYINGDTYYKIKYPGHNLVRTRAQYRLLQSMEAQYGQMKEIIEKLAAKYSPR